MTRRRTRLTLSPSSPNRIILLARKPVLSPCGSRRSRRPEISRHKIVACCSRRHTCYHYSARAGESMTQDQQIRQQLAKALDWGEAHPDFRTVVDNFPVDLRGEVPPGFTHSAWELLEHLRIALWDIVEFSKDARHKSPPWPQGYWPPSPVPPQLEAWDQCVGTIVDLLEEMRGLILDSLAPSAGTVSSQPRTDIDARSATDYHSPCVPPGRDRPSAKGAEGVAEVA